MDADIGFVTQIGMAYEEAFEVAEDLDFDYVELMLDGAHERTCLDPDAVESKADDWIGTLSLEVFTLDYGYIGTSKTYLDELL